MSHEKNIFIKQIVMSVMFGVHIDRYMVMTSNIIQFCINVNAFRFPVISTSIQSKHCVFRLY